jgi:hypothetical protein
MLQSGVWNRMANRNWTRIYLNKVPERSFWVGLLISTAYLSYRYPLQINSSTTSQVYSDTPLSLQVGKFVLIFLTCCISAPFLFWKRLTRLQAGVVLLTAMLFSFPLFKLLGGVESRYLEISFWPLAALVLVVPLKTTGLHALDKYLKALFFFAVISDVIEVSLFLLFGRLPALAWSGGLSVRFGGFLDDPNGFAAILFLLMGWSFYRFRGKSRFFMEFALVVCLLLTQSLTAIGFFGALLLVLMCWRLIKKPLFIFWIFAGCAVLVGLLEVTHALDIIVLLIALKAGSASDHLSISWSGLIDKWNEWFFFGGRSYEFYESWWLSSLLSFGVVWYVGYLLLTSVLVYMVLRSFRSCQTKEEKAVLAGIFLFCSYFMVGSANLPLPIIFPINFLFYAFCFVICFRKTSSGTSRQSILSSNSSPLTVRV